MVACVDDAILDLLDRNIVGKGVKRPIFFLWGEKGFELGDLSLLEVELDSDSSAEPRFPFLRFCSSVPSWAAEIYPYFGTIRLRRKEYGDYADS